MYEDCYRGDLFHEMENLESVAMGYLLSGELAEAERLAWQREGVQWAADRLRARTKYSDNIKKDVLGT